MEVTCTLEGGELDSLLHLRVLFCRGWWWWVLVSMSLSVCC